MVILHNCNVTKSHTCQVDNPQTGKYLYQENSPTEVKVLSPWGSGMGEEGDSRSLALKASRNSTGLEETENPHLEGTQRSHKHLDAGKKAVTS